MKTSQKTKALYTENEKKRQNKDLFEWPVPQLMITATIKDLYKSGNPDPEELFARLEQFYAVHYGVRHCIAVGSGQAAMQLALKGCGVDEGHQVICPAICRWDLAVQPYALGASLRFADVQPHSLCIDPASVGKQISANTRAVIVTDHRGMVPDFEGTGRELENRNDIRIIEEFTDGMGGHIGEKRLGTFGDVAVATIMSGGEFDVPVGAVILTDDSRIYNRIQLNMRGRMTLNQSSLLTMISAHFGIDASVQIKVEQALACFRALGRCSRLADDVRQAYYYFHEAVEAQAGYVPIYSIGNNDMWMGGWQRHYARIFSNDSGGCDLRKFAKRIERGGSSCSLVHFEPLHLAPLFRSADIFQQGKPTQLANSVDNARPVQSIGSLPVAESLSGSVAALPYFKRLMPRQIDQHAKIWRRALRSLNE
jgi:perosamine synthetase